MKKMLILFSALLFIAGLSTLQAQTAEEIVDNYLEAIGGKEQLSAVSSTKMTAKAKAQGMELPITMYQKPPGMMRMDMVFQGKEVTQMAFNGEEGWSTNFMTMEAEKWDAEQSEVMKSDMDFLNAFLQYSDKGYSVALEGEEEVEGTACFKVKLTKKPVVVDGKEEDNFSYYYFDKEAFVPIMQEEYAKSGPMKGQASQTYFSDYQEVEGLYFPFNIAQKFQGQTVFDLTVEKIELNAAVEDGLFNYPEPAPTESKE
ncbi:MAG: outer membrane lipoprotein-sorting protein [Lewinellaceae bacterium]|nr:outer membrane lipoprotein-sorting protein [Phaeodactylibacter sp.]MCB0611653.1 outer membrane lipoprotein-sorting protein [Phaeodactylibacter sp.]MCB9347448.1 outer membrane lipoprotein-sorting protein [Lewinellaceae bacterium]